MLHRNAAPSLPTTRTAIISRPDGTEYRVTYDMRTGGVLRVIKTVELPRIQLPFDIQCQGWDHLNA